MQDVSKNEGRTVLFVSHNMFSIKKLCNKGLLLQKGTVRLFGNLSNVVEEYEIETTICSKSELSKRTNREGNGKVKATNCVLINKYGEPSNSIVCGDSITIEISLTRFLKSYVSSNIQVSVNICNLSGEKAVQFSNFFINEKIRIKDEVTVIQYKADNFPLNPGSYSVRLYISDNNEILDWVDYCFIFHITAGDFFKTGKIDNSSVFFLDHHLVIKD